MAYDDIDKNLEQELNQLLAAKTEPVFTAEDFRFRVEHYLVPANDTQERLVATYGKAGRYFESDTLVKLERIAQASNGEPSKPATDTLNELLPTLVTDTVPCSIDTAVLAKLTEALAEVQPLANLHGFYYREAVYALPGYLVSIFYPAIGREAKKRPITAFVRPSTGPVSHLVGTDLPPVVDSVEVAVSGNRIMVNWSANHIGWGQFHFWDGRDGLIHCDNENMSRDFIKAVLAKVIDDLELNNQQVSSKAVTTTLGKVLPDFVFKEDEPFPSTQLKQALNTVVDEMALEDC